jgi:hypothetical protein
MKKQNYVIILLLFLVVFVLFNYIYKLKKRLLNTEILQINNFNFDNIQEVLSQNQPTIFYQIMYDWIFIGDIHILDINQINDVINVNKSFTKALEHEMYSFSLFYSPNWKFDIFEQENNEKTHYFRKNNLYRFFIGQITGKQHIYLCSPNQEYILEKNSKIESSDKGTQNQNNKSSEKELINSEKFNTTVSTIDFWNPEENNKEPFNKLQYIEIILKEGNLLYIPYGWWYLTKNSDNKNKINNIDNTEENKNNDENNDDNSNKKDLVIHVHNESIFNNL